MATTKEIEFFSKGNTPQIHTVEIPCEGACLAGDLNIPGDAPGIVLFAHGSGSNRHSPRNQYVARIIRESGQGTLLFDLLTEEEEARDLSTCEFRFDIQLLAGRLLEATQWITTQAEPRGLGIGYFGSSTGGAAALVAAGEAGRTVGAVVSRGGRVDLAGDALKGVESPTLLIVGELDDVVLRINEQAYSRLHCPKELKAISGATHLFGEEGALEKVAHLAADWFRRHLGTRDD